MIFFAIELIIASIAKDEYFLGFYFWLDLVATLSLITDIGWIWNRIMGTQDVGAANAEQASQLARAGRGARVGTRAGRVARIIRLIRLIRIVKLYKNANAALAKEENLDELPVEEIKQKGKDGEGAANDPSASVIKIQQLAPRKEADFEGDEDFKIPEESKVGKKLSDLTTRRVIILVLAMLFSVPVFTVSTFVQDYNGYEVGLQLIGEFVPRSPGFNDAFEAFVIEGSALRTPLILASAADVSWQQDLNPDSLRTDEKEIISYTNDNTEYTYVAIYDLRQNTQF